MRFTAPVFIFLTLILQIQAFEVETLVEHIKITELQNAVPPQIINDKLLLTYQGKGYNRVVGVAFEHENFQEIHLYMRNEFGILVFLYPIPEELEQLHYRIIVDGLWMTDPLCYTSVRDSSGIRLSQIGLPKKDEVILSTPVFLKNRQVEFFFKGDPGSRIFLVGDFNNWDPFMNKLKEVKPGEFSITLSLLPGKHYYYYIVDGMRHIDPMNFNTVASYAGYTVNSFVIN